MNRSDTIDVKRKHTVRLIFNIVVMVSSFAIALIALPQEMFFIVAILILFALRDIEKDLSSTTRSRGTVLPRTK